MSLREYLLENRDELLEEWFSLIWNDYPDESISYINRKKDQFANPLRYHITSGISALFDLFLQNPQFDHEKTVNALEEIVKIKAVQDFSPSQALSFIFKFKNTLRKLYLENKIEEVNLEELFHFESLIDQAGLTAFDIFMRCREKVYDIKAEEIKRSTYMLLRKSQQVS